MSEMLYFQWEQVVLMLGEAGYALLESLIGLMLLGIVSLSLMVALPILLDEHERLDHEQAIYHKLLELHGRGIEDNITVMEPFEFEAFRRGYEWCAVYEWRDGYERTICL